MKTIVPSPRRAILGEMRKAPRLYLVRNLTEAEAEDLNHHEAEVPVEDREERLNELARAGL